MQVYNNEKRAYSIELHVPKSMANAHYHNFYEIYYLKKGKAKYLINNSIFDINERDLVLIPPYTIHKTIYGKDIQSERLLISFTPDFLKKKENDTLFHCFKKIHIKHTDTYVNLIDSIVSEYNNPDDCSEELIKLYITALLLKLSREKEKQHHIITSSSVILDVIGYISNNYSLEITLTKLAEEFHISKSHLSRQFKVLTGIGINEYINNIRVLNAETLLLTTDLSMTEIATRCGFNNSNYFSYVFKKFKGIAPLKFITLLRDDDTIRTYMTTFKAAKPTI